MSATAQRPSGRTTTRAVAADALPSRASLPGFETLDAVRRRLRGLIIGAGLCVVITILLSALIVAGVVDWALRLPDVETRVALSLAVWGIILWTGWRMLVAPLLVPLEDVWIAQQIDDRYPGFAGRFRSATEFLTTTNPDVIGSRELQALVIRQAARELERVRPEEVVQPRHLYRKVCAAAGVVLVGCLIALAFPEETAIAMQRHFRPWVNTPWPRATLLQLVTTDGQPLGDVARVVRGETLELRVENIRGHLPESVWLETREPGSPTVATELLRQVRPPSASNSTAASQLSLTANLEGQEFRVVGGDDDQMVWRRLEVVEPPSLESFTIEVIPPAYAREPIQTWPAGSTFLHGLIGSRVRISATSTLPLRSAQLAYRDRPPLPLELDAEHRRWNAELTIEQSGTSAFWFALVSEQGFSESRPVQFELRGDVDALPEITLVEPESDMIVTSEATIPVHLLASDDRGLLQLRRTFQRDDMPSQTELLQGLTDLPRESRLETTWSLKELSLQPGERLVFRVEAQDACDLGEPHIGKSAPRTLVIVGPEEKRADLADRIGELLEDLRESQRQQERLRQQTRELEVQSREVEMLQAADRDALDRLQLDQRRLGERLTNDRAGLARRAARLSEEFRENGLTDEEAAPQLARMARQLGRLSEDTLPEIDRELTQTSKLQESPTDTRQTARETAEALKHAAMLQDDVAQTLAEQRQQLERWQAERGLADDLEALVQAQEQLTRDTAEVGAQTLSKSLAELMPQQRADLQKLADRQRQLAREIEQFERDVEGLAERVEDTDAARSTELSDALEKLRSQQLNSRLRQAADDLAANRLGSAGPAQQDVRELLETLRKELDESSPDDAEQLMKRVAEAEQQAEELASDVEQLRKNSSGAPAAPSRESLEEDAQSLRKQTQKLERQLERLRMERPGDAAHRAAEHLSKAEELAADPNARSELQQELAEAQEDIEQLRDELRTEREQVREQLAQLEVERIADALQALRTRQDGVIVETQRLDAERVERGRLSRGQSRSLQDLARLERDLSKDATRLRDQLQAALVAKTALASVARSLEQAATRLEQRETDRLTQQLEREAAQRLERVLAAWNRKDDAAPGGQPQAAEADDAQSSPPPGEGISLKTQLALLRELQADCLDRTSALEAARSPDGSMPPELVPLLDALATEQAELVDLAKHLIERLQQDSGRPRNGAPR